MNPDLMPERIEIKPLPEPTKGIAGIIRQVNSVTRDWRRPLMALPLTLSVLALACQTAVAKTAESPQIGDRSSLSQEIPAGAGEPPPLVKLEPPVPPAPPEPLKTEPPPPPDKTKGLPDNAPDELKRLYGEVDEVAKYSTHPKEFSAKIKQLFYESVTFEASPTALRISPRATERSRANRLYDTGGIIIAQYRATGQQELYRYLTALGGYVQVTYPDFYQETQQYWQEPPK